jgi:hypothetical protein
MGTVKDLTGKIFGRLTVISMSHVEKGKSVWNCKCSCGSSVKVVGVRISTGHTRSCGCMPVVEGHGDVGTKFYRVWRNIRQRCHDVNSDRYQWYGAKGIYVCDRWRNDYLAFKSDMLSSYQKACADYGEDQVSIDRIDPTKGYEYSNCQWITRSENSSKLNSQNRNSVNGQGAL